MRSSLAILAPIILLLGCQKDIQNKEAVRQGVVEYLSKRADLIAMDVSVSTVSFRKDEADATVYVQAKDGAAAGKGMEMRYLLERKNGHWVVKGRGGASANPHGTAEASPALPPGHPQIPSGSRK